MSGIITEFDGIRTFQTPSKPSGRKGYQILVVKEWVTNEHDSAKDLVLQSECSISLNPGQTALFWECFEIPNRIGREGFKGRVYNGK